MNGIKCPTHNGNTYFFIYFLIPKYLLTRRFFLFGLHFLYTVIISLYLEMLSTLAAFMVYANYQFENMNPLSVDTVTMGVTIFFIVFVTAFGQLLKKFLITQDELEELSSEKEKDRIDTIQIRSDRKMIPVQLDQLCYIESLADYVKIHTNSDTFITKEKISKLEEKLPSYFLRIHRSYLVNAKLIKSFTKESINVCEQQLPISRTYKPNVMQILMAD